MTLEIPPKEESDFVDYRDSVIALLRRMQSWARYIISKVKFRHYITSLNWARLTNYFMKSQWKNHYYYFILTQGYFFIAFYRVEGRDRGTLMWQWNIDAREKHQLIASPTSLRRHLDWELNTQPRYVPWQGVKPTTFWLRDDVPTNWAILARARNQFLIQKPYLSRYFKNSSASWTEEGCR